MYLFFLGTSEKTRNLPTRADTLGVDSRWESEPGTGFMSKTPNEQDFYEDTRINVSGTVI